LSGDNILLFGCGDVGPIHPPVETYSALVRDTLATGDLRFAQAERLYSTRGSLQSHCTSDHMRVAPEMASIFSDCGFDVVSVASNHGLDCGSEALLDSIDVFKSRGITPIGGGKNIAEASKPALFARNGIRVAFLAYCSVLHEGYAAEENKVGISPLRAHTYYQPYESQPGIPPQVITVPFESDLHAMARQIAEAKKNAHCLVVSMHWGIHHIPKMLADYQRIAAKVAFDAGADVILGHHPHLPKGIEVYNGKVCFYSLGDFMMSLREITPEKAAAYKRRYEAFGGKLNTDPAYARLPHGLDGIRSLIAKIVLTKEGVQSVSFLPVLIDRQLRPEILHKDNPRFDEAIQYMDWVSEDLNHHFSVGNDEVVVEG
jgi:poly-gamma-glutamate synthesis protein (capsule biosynthesis protein)